MFKTISFALLFIPLLLSGCATPKYACGVPDGIGCKSLSEVQRMAKDGTLKQRAAPNNRGEESTAKKHTARSDVEKLAAGTKPKTTPHSEADIDAPTRIVPEVITVTPSAPILIPPRTLRVWVARWPDEDGTLHDETYLYLKLDNGRWAME